MHFAKVLFRHPQLWAGRFPWNAGKAAGAAAVSLSSQGMWSCRRTPLTSVTLVGADLNPRAAGGRYIITPSDVGYDWRTVLSCNFPAWLKDQQVLSLWGQGCKSSQDQGQGAQFSCRHAACLCAASCSCSVAEFFGCFLVPGQDWGFWRNCSPLGNAY